VDGFKRGLPASQLIFSIIEDLAAGVDALIWRMRFPRYNGGVVYEIQQTTSLLGQDDLLLSTFDCGREVHVKGLFEFLACLHVGVNKGTEQRGRQ
jgi:hypothetical protein